MLKWTWTTFFLEIRILLSTLFVILFFYKMHMLDSILKPYFESAISRRNKLRVEFEDFSVDIWKGEGFVKNAIMYHPTIEEDPRWYFEYMAYAESIKFTFDPLKALYGFFTNRMKLLVFDTITVQGIDLFVEGYEEEGKKTVLNLKLIGGEIPRRIRRRKPTQLELRQREKEREKNEREKGKMRKAAAAASSKRAAVHATPLPPHDKNGSPPPLSATATATATAIPVVHATPAAAVEVVSGGKTGTGGWGSTANLFRKSISSKLQEWHTEVGRIKTGILLHTHYAE
jgi:hypothetical protein